MKHLLCRIGMHRWERHSIETPVIPIGGYEITDDEELSIVRLNRNCVRCGRGETKKILRVRKEQPHECDNLGSYKSLTGP